MRFLCVRTATTAHQCQRPKTTTHLEVEAAVVRVLPHAQAHVGEGEALGDVAQGDGGHLDAHLRRVRHTVPRVLRLRHRAHEQRHDAGHVGSLGDGVRQVGEQQEQGALVHGVVRDDRQTEDGGGGGAARGADDEAEEDLVGDGDDEGARDEVSWMLSSFANVFR